MKLQRKPVSDFFNNDYINFASYDNLRKIASLVDGQKNSSRKILWYTQQKNQKTETKVSQLDSKVAEFTEYLHGSMAGVIVNLAQNHTGTNNINLMMPEGNFGTRLVPDASAARYIYTYGSPEFFDIFSKDDDDILDHQYFEGHMIEPKFMLPKLPMLLVNGAEGITSGFAQKILPRNPASIKKYIIYYLEDPTRPKKPFRSEPWYRGFNGSTAQQAGGYPNQWEFTGIFTRKANKVIVTELPIGFNLKSYIKVLDKLEDDKKIITYTDFSNKGFHFEVQFNRKYLDSLSDEQLISLLKLKKKITENYTATDENNRVQSLGTVDEIMQRYTKVKLLYLQKRKDHKLKRLSSDIRFLVSKYFFIKAITDKTLVVSNKKIHLVEADLAKLDKVIQKDESWDYLLNMSIRSLTTERMDKLLQEIKDSKVQLDHLKTQTIEQIWLEELN